MRLIIIVFLALSSNISFSQNFTITAQKLIGGDNMDNLFSYKSPYDDGFFFIGSSESNISGDKTENSFGSADVWLVKTDASFNIEWDKTYGGSGYDDSYSLLFNEDTIIILSLSSSPISGNKTVSEINGTMSDVWLIEVNPNNGAIYDQHVLGGDFNEGYPIGLIDENSDEIVLSFTSSSSNSGTIGIDSISWDDVYICKYNLNSKQVTQETYIGASGFETLNFIEIVNSEIIVGLNSEGGSGNITTASYGLDDTYFFRLDENLDIISYFNYGGSETDNLIKLIEHNGEIYALGSSSSQASGNKTSDNYGNTLGFWMVKFDGNFNYIYDVSYGGFGSDLMNDAFFDNNGRLVVGLTSQVLGPGGDRDDVDFFGQADLWVIILEPSNGSLIAQAAFGGNNQDFCRGILPLDNSGNFLITASTVSSIGGSLTETSNGGMDVWLIEVDASDYLSINEDSPTQAISVFPNPTSSTLNIRSELNLKEVCIINSSGRKVLSTNQNQIDVSSFSNGLYFLQGKLEDGSIVREKFVKE